MSLSTQNTTHAPTYTYTYNYTRLHPPTQSYTCLHYSILPCIRLHTPIQAYTNIHTPITYILHHPSTLAITRITRLHPPTPAYIRLHPPTPPTLHYTLILQHAPTTSSAAYIRPTNHLNTCAVPILPSHTSLHPTTPPYTVPTHNLHKAYS